MQHSLMRRVEYQYPSEARPTKAIQMYDIDPKD